MFWTVAAWAAAPDREVALVGSSVESVAVSDQGRLVVGVGGGAVVGLSTLDWESGTWDGCQVTAAAVTTGTADDPDALVVSVGCQDGHVYRLEYNEAGHQFTVLDEFELFEQNGPVHGIFAVPDLDRVLAVVDPDSGYASLYVIEDGVAPTSWTQIGYNYENGVFSTVGDVDTLFLTINRGTVVPVGATGAIQSGPLNTLQIDLRDIAAAPGGIYGMTSTGIYSASTSQPWSNVMLEYYESPGALVGSPSDTDAWFLFTLGTEARVYDTNPPIGDPVATFPVASELRDLVAVPDGYAFGAGGSGIAVLTANPWIADLEADVGSGTVGTVVTVSFSCADAVDWEIVVGGDRAGTGGRSVGSGSAVAAEAVVTSVTIDDTWLEGDNLVFVRATDAAGREGYDAVHVSVDNPPSIVAFSDADVTFADGGLNVQIRGVDDADVDHYLLYVTTTAFEAADYPSGGPVYEGPDTSVTSPITVKDGVAPGADVATKISGLTNGATYYLAVRTVDTGGQVGAMSDVAVGMPEETFTAGELSGEKGGSMGCSTVGGGAGAAMIAAGLMLVRRKRAGALLVGLLATGAAWAGDAEKREGPLRDATKNYGTFELRYGGLHFDDHLSDGTACDDLATPSGTCALREIYGTTGTNVLTVGFGGDVLAALQGGVDKKYRPTSVVQADLQIGFFQKIARTVSASGATSGEKTMITTWPMGAGLKLRLHILDEQFIVPYVRAGAEIVPWSEKWDNAAGGKDALKGTKYGANLSIGGQILIDGIDRSRASLLEAQTGVNDTYLTIEYRRNDTCIAWKCKATASQDAEGLAFSGSQLTFGLALGF